MVYIAVYGHFDSSCKGFEDGFYFVVFVGSLGFYVEIDACFVGECFEEVLEHFCGHVAYFFSFKCCVPHEPWAVAEVNGDLCERVVHGECESVALDALFVS